MKETLVLAIAGVLAATSAALSAESGTLRLATTTSTYETGLLDHLLPPFQKKHGVEVHVISVGTGKAIRLAEAGDVDVILVHAREAEDRFVEAGYGINRRDVMHNDFLILGPQADPAGVRGLKDAGEALTRIKATRAIFVSRGDDSGTHKKEQELWARSGQVPLGEWYLEAGQGMNATLRMADEKDGYVLIDRATYLANRKRIRLRTMVEGDPDLLNPYGIIAVSPYLHPHAKYELAMVLIAWLTSPECQAMIGEFSTDGERLFHPGAAAPAR